MKIRPVNQLDIVSIERIAEVVEGEDETLNTQELDPGTYALDSYWRVWKLIETVTGLMEHFTETDPIGKRRKAKRTSGRT